MIPQEFDERRSRREASRKHELLPQVIAYPLEYFQAQVEFAYKLVELLELGGITVDIADILLQKTAIYRRLIGHKATQGEMISELWDKVSQYARKAPNPEIFASYLYGIYASGQGADPAYREKIPENDGRHFGYFSFERVENSEKYDGRTIIRLHFDNLSRGAKSALSEEMALQHHESLRQMFAQIKASYPDEPLLVVGESWLYHVPHYKKLFPPKYIDQSSLVETREIHQLPGQLEEIYFEGNSLWGQFMNRFGGVRRDKFDEFMEKVRNAVSIEELFHAFPYIPQRHQAEIEVFYEFFGVN